VWGDGLARLLRAGAQQAAGDGERAAASLTAAISALEAAGMQLYAAAARRALGIVIRDPAVIASAEASLRAIGVVHPARMAAMLVPGV
jgi:eukaryotic-like serine/threonine-protein kinase